ncbi:MAG: SDR family NAD(P)-dependent oxidoreductase [Ktedonobacterales bacterium]|nr:SDR family NAD(P)-dependent oxidoreductase [Ktedonobacterales bacterium]
MQHVVVTGVSTGIGLGITRVLAGAGIHVFGSVRRAVDAKALVAEFGDRFTPLIFDVTNEAAVRAGAAQVREQLAGATLLGLVNNAGIAVPGPLLHVAIAGYRHQIDVNLTGPLIVTQAFAPLLGATKDFAGTPGRIVMISSVGGRMAAPFLGPYHASKFGLEGLSDTLRREMMLYGIDVVIVEPGAVATPIWDKAETVDVAQYAATDYAPMLEGYKKFMIADGRKGLPPERIGQVVQHALISAHPRTRYPALRGQLRGFTIPRLLPDRLVDRFIARSLHLVRKPQGR